MKNQNIHVTQIRGNTLHLYTFSPREYVQPAASAYQQWLILGGGDGSSFILRGDTELRRHLKKGWPSGRIVRGRSRIANPRNSKVKDALAAEATRFKKFDDFADAYWNSCARGLYWVAVDEKKFYIGEHEKKQIAAGRFKISCSPSLALSGKDEGRKYVAELDVTRVPEKSIRVKRGTNGSEVFVTASAGSVKVERVLEADKAMRSFKWQLSILPSSKEGLREVWEKSWARHNKEVAKAAVRRHKTKEREEKRGETKVKKESDARKRQAKKLEREEKRLKSAREARGRRARKAAVGKGKKPAQKGTWKRVPNSSKRT